MFSKQWGWDSVIYSKTQNVGTLANNIAQYGNGDLTTWVPTSLFTLSREAPRALIHDEPMTKSDVLLVGWILFFQKVSGIVHYK